MPDTLAPYRPAIDPQVIEKALTLGDVSKMDPHTRVQYYQALCESLGLNWLTRPFILLKTQDGGLQWYATVGCTDQLRKRDRVSVRIVGRERLDDGLLCVTAEATTPDGRCEQSQGIVALTTGTGPLKGQELANALMRAESKARRRCTLAICGLGLPLAEPDTGQAVRFDPQTGEILEEAPPAVLAAPVVSAERARQNLGEMFDVPDTDPRSLAPESEPAPDQNHQDALQPYSLFLRHWKGRLIPSQLNAIALHLTGHFVASLPTLDAATLLAGHEGLRDWSAWLEGQDAATLQGLVEPQALVDAYLTSAARAPEEVSG